MLPHRVPPTHPAVAPPRDRGATPTAAPPRDGAATPTVAPPRDGAATRTVASSRGAAAPTIRPLRAGEADLLDGVFAGLSDQSRYQRFHGPKPRLTASERAYLAAVDDRDHLAVVAEAPDGSPLGLARCVRVRDDRTTADVAAEVVDPWQRRGIGTDMVRRLALRAAGAGIERLSATVLAETGLHRALLRRGWRVTAAGGPALTLEVPVWALLAADRPGASAAA